MTDQSADQDYTNNIPQQGGSGGPSVPAQAPRTADPFPQQQAIPAGNNDQGGQGMTPGQGAIPRDAQAISGAPGQFDPGGQGTPAQAVGQAISGAAGAVGGAAKNIAGYLAGESATGQQVTKEQFEQQNKAVDPNNSMDQSERSMRIAASGPDGFQAVKQHYNAQIASSRKMLAEGNEAGAVSEANKASDYMPDGTKVIYSHGNDGITATVHTMDGQSEKMNLSSEQFNGAVQGPLSHFDTQLGLNSATVIKALTQSGGVPIQPAQNRAVQGSQGPAGAGGGQSPPPAGQQPGNQVSGPQAGGDLSNDPGVQSGGEFSQAVGEGNAPGSKPQAPAMGQPGAGAPDQASQGAPPAGQQGAPAPAANQGDSFTMQGDVHPMNVSRPGQPTPTGHRTVTPAPFIPSGRGIVTTMGGNGQPQAPQQQQPQQPQPQQPQQAPQSPRGGPQQIDINRTLNSPAGVTVPKGGGADSTGAVQGSDGVWRRAPTYNNPDDPNRLNNGPISIVRGGQTQVVGNLPQEALGDASPVEQARAKIMFPNNPTKQAEFLQAQSGVRQAQGAKLEEVKNTHLYGNQATATGRVQGAQIRADNPNAAGVAQSHIKAMAEYDKANPAATPQQRTQRSMEVTDEIRQAQTAIQKRTGSVPDPRQTIQKMSEPTATNPDTGERMVLRDGQWQQLK